MAERNAPGIMRYECIDAPEGYNFIYVDNQTRTHCYVEEMSYDLFEGVQLMPTQSTDGKIDIDNQRYKITVPPMNRKIVLVKTQVKGFTTSASCSRHVTPWTGFVDF